MREINKTMYKILKMEEPEDGVNVSQLITDDLIQKSESGEVKAKDGASDLLNKKADLIHGKNTTLKKNLKASGARVTSSSGGTSPGTKKIIKKKVAKKAGGTGTVRVKKKVIKKAGTKTGARVVKKKPTSKQVEKKSSPVAMIVLLVLVLAGAGYYYMEFMQ